MLLDKQKQVYTYAIGAVLIWATVASAFKISLRYVDYLQLLFYSTAVSLLCLFGLLITQKKTSILRTYTRKEYAQSLLLGFLNPFLYYTVLFKAYSLLSAQQAQPLNYTWPIVVVVLSIPLLQQRIRPINIIAVLVGFCGVVLIITQGNIHYGLENLQGVLYALASAFIWAIFWILTIRDKRDNVAKLFLNFTFGFMCIFIVTPWFSSVILPPVSGILGVVYVGVFEMGITFVIWMKALSMSKTTAQVSNLIYVSPFLSLIFIHFLVGEQIHFSTVLGLIIIVTGILLQYYSSPKKYSCPSG